MHDLFAQIGFEDLHELIPIGLVLATALIWSIRQEARAKYAEKTVDKLEKSLTKLNEKLFDLELDHSRLKYKVERKKDDD